MGIHASYGTDSPVEDCNPLANIYCAVTRKDLPFLEDPTGINLARTAAQYSDGIILGAERIDPEIVDYCKSLGLPILPFDRQALDYGGYIDGYCGFYDEL